MLKRILLSCLVLSFFLLSSCEGLFFLEDPFEGNLSIGNTGPAGGIVVFIDVNREFDFDYIEASPVDIGTDNAEFPWGQNIAVPGTSDSIGAGAANTELIIEYMDPEWGVSSDYAAKAASEFSHGGFSDWFLPSKDELNLIHEYRELFSGLRPNQYYWSSTDADGSVTWVWSQIVNSDTGRQANSGSGKTNTRPVRPVRTFSESDL